MKKLIGYRKFIGFAVAVVFLFAGGFFFQGDIYPVYAKYVFLSMCIFTGGNAIAKAFINRR